MLVDLGYLRGQHLEQSSGHGRPKSPLFLVNPLARTQNPQNTQTRETGSNSEDFVDSVYAVSVEEHNQDQSVFAPSDDVGEL